MVQGLKYTTSSTQTGTELCLFGELARGDVRQLCAVLRGIRLRAGEVLSLDLSEVEGMDSAVVAALIGEHRRVLAQGIRIQLGAVSDSAQRALSMFRVNPQANEVAKPAGMFESMGESMYSTRDSLIHFLQLTADCVFAVAHHLVRPTKIRWKALTEQGIDIGSRALGIVALITFLVGLTVAFQSAHQLRQFGAAIFVADLTAVSMVREMAPLMTAILVAGRSGASIAAEVATMKVSEEVDALTVMGIDPIEFLAVPKLIAIVLTVPLLTVMADFVGMLGGFIVGVGYLDIAWNAFLSKMIDSLVAWDLISGLIKSVAFAFGIGLIGLFFGFRVRGGASEVGRTTTAAVVASIFYIIVADCVFSVLFYVVL